MPFGTVPPSTGWRVKVGTSSPATVPVGGVNKFSWRESSTVSKDPFYNDDATNTNIGPVSVSTPISGKKKKGDSGQAIIRAAAKNQTTIFVQVTEDGVDGEEVEVRCSNWNLDGNDPEQATDWSVDLDQVNAATTVGAGF